MESHHKYWGMQFEVKTDEIEQSSAVVTRQLYGKGSRYFEEGCENLNSYPKER